MKREPDFTTPFRLSLIAHCAAAAPGRSGSIRPMPRSRRHRHPAVVVLDILAGAVGAAALAAAIFLIWT